MLKFSSNVYVAAVKVSLLSVLASVQFVGTALAQIPDTGVPGAGGPGYGGEKCVHVGTRNFTPLEVYDAGHFCGSCEGQAQKPDLCGAINRYMIPDNSKKHDLLLIPHRGVWGMPLDHGPAENTIGAMAEALTQGYRVIEIDVAFVKPQGPTSDFEAWLGHYFNMAAYGGRSDKAPGDFTPTQLFNFKMNKRSQVIGTHITDRMYSSRKALMWARDNQVLLTFDPKIPANPTPDELEKITAAILYEAWRFDALPNVVIKTGKSYQSQIAKIEEFVVAMGGNWSEIKNSFLWSPIVNPKATDDLTTVMKNIEDWNVATDNSRRIVTYEIAYFNPDHWASNTFLFPTQHGASFDGLIDYVLRMNDGVGVLGKRSTLWSIDPMGNKGTLGRMYNWKFIGNTDDDKRGNPITTLGYSGVLHSAIITDRPDVFNGMLADP